ncbi:glycerophosphodiester phosphodiesterase [Aquimarina sp. AD10]|uniref:glycerophosphodiester phosphodiesterase n=1 Tax=Aquimarina sp. AD10 TaxID=1714849 RepID=UPI000E4F4DBD|nr:glycerophosphodiester phosphodiesterase [Aquimarina sp. AD10]AXT63189.1 glycerophosphodiester phosphodiesterase [Aquimarina sp. AD10]RKM98596.1 glycerophosphodiester phosphodiesterase [Aquimarina sp. AD10]
MKPLKHTLLLLITIISFTSCDFLDDYTGGPTPDKKPLIIAHRGAQSLLPEHTLQGYVKAIELGADFIEPDLVLTKDGHLVVRHEPMLSGTTNVADLPEFTNLKTTKELDGKMVTDWFAIDFTLAQIKTLKARQAFGSRPKDFDDQFDIPTFEEVILLAKKQSIKGGKTIGIYPEIKHPLFHNNFFGTHVMENKLLYTLKKAGLNRKNAPVFVQCFEVEPLQYINSKSPVKLVQLISTYNINKDGSLDYNVPSGDFISYGSPFDFYSNGDSRTYEFFTTEEGMKFTATYADGIGPWKPFIISYKTEESGELTLLPATDFISLAHKNNLLVHPYTFRNENTQWSGGNPEREYHLFFDAGVDGLFTDYTDEAVKALETWRD